LIITTHVEKQCTRALRLSGQITNNENLSCKEHYKFTNNVSSLREKIMHESIK